MFVTSEVSRGNGSAPLAQQGTTINVKDAGAKGDGRSDDAPAINQAIATLTAKGGGTLYIPQGTYLLTSTTGSNNVLIAPKSNIHIKGDGIDKTILKVSNGLNAKFPAGFNVIYSSSSDPREVINNFSVEQLTIDENGGNNITDNVKRYKNAGVGVRYGNNITVSKVKVVNNPGRQCISIGNNTPENIVKTVTVRDCIFKNMADAVPGNDAQNDHSTIFIIADGQQVIGNTITNDNFSQATTAIELSGYNGTIQGNTIANVHKAFNVISALMSTHDMSYTNNKCTNIQMAFATVITPGKSLSNIDVENNNFSFQRSNRPAYFDLSANVDKSVTGNTISIVNNKIDEVGGDDGQGKTPYIFKIANPRRVDVSKNIISTNGRLLMNIMNGNAGCSITVQNNDVSINGDRNGSSSDLIQIQVPDNGDDLLISNNNLHSRQRYNFFGKNTGFRKMNVGNNKYSSN
jgi:predicted nucleic-acid-binding Zn-ribbon protein